MTAADLVPTPMDLARTFDARDTGLRVGLEYECGLVDPETGVSVPYAGPGGSRDLLTVFLDEFDAEPIRESECLVGIRLRDGSELGLETGGALEYSALPAAGLDDAVTRTREIVRQAADIAASLGIAVLSGAIQPFTTTDAIPWNPKSRVRVMRNYLASLGDVAADADPVMGVTLSTQVSLDYESEADLLEKLRLQSLAAPIASALFLNSPLADGVTTGALSRRMQYWSRMDPARCGTPAFAIASDARIEDLVDWCLSVPMIYRRQGSRHVAAPLRSMGRAFKEGFGDGTWPTLEDWALHLCQVWPTVRVRRALEMRAPDGLPWLHFGASAAFWVGLTYDAGARRAALDLLTPLNVRDLDDAMVRVPVHGLDAIVGPYKVDELCRELLHISRHGLGRRVEAGHEPPAVLALLDPLDEVAHTSTTFAQICLDRWDTDFGRRPSAYVAANRVID